MTKNSLSWQEFETELQSLKNQVDFTPDIIVAITRGGIIPARLLSTYLKVKTMFCLTVKKSGKKRLLLTHINDDLKGKNVLLVEDMLETGKSLTEARQYLIDQGASVKTTCLYIMPISEIKPDYYLKTVQQAVRFPWE
jgi:uncharacterized protein